MGWNTLRRHERPSGHSPPQSSPITKAYLLPLLKACQICHHPPEPHYSIWTTAAASQLVSMYPEYLFRSAVWSQRDHSKTQTRSWYAARPDNPVGMSHLLCLEGTSLSSLLPSSHSCFRHQLHITSSEVPSLTPGP